MAKDTSQKLKMTRILDMLRMDSSKEEPLTTDILCSRLMNEFQIVCDRRTLSTDIQYMCEHGFDIKDCRVGHKKAYYIESQDEKLSVSDMKIILEAIQASSFIPEDKSGQLTDKLIRIAGGEGAGLLKKSKVCFNVTKHTSDDTIKNIDTISTAISGGKCITFYYFDYNERSEKVYRYDKELYTAEPLAMIYINDRYYLIAYSLNRQEIRTYRIDRMDEVLLTDQAAEHTEADIPVDDYKKQVFMMYGGEPIDVILSFDKSMINVIFDKFGIGTPMMKKDENTFFSSVVVQESQMFYGWLVSLGGKMKIVSPEALDQRYREWIRKSIGEENDENN